MRLIKNYILSRNNKPESFKFLTDNSSNFSRASTFERLVVGLMFLKIREYTLYKARPFHIFIL